MSENFQFISHQLTEHMVKSEEDMAVEEDNDYEVDNQLKIKPEIDMNLLDQPNSGTDSAEEEEVDDDQQESSNGQQVVSNVVFNEGDQIMTASSLGSDQSTSNGDKPSAVVWVKVTKCSFNGCLQMFADMRKMAEHYERDHKQASARKKNTTPLCKAYKPTEADQTVDQNMASDSDTDTADEELEDNIVDDDQLSNIGNNRGPTKSKRPDDPKSSGGRFSTMSLFSATKCTFNGCSKVFPNWTRMVEHCERDHKRICIPKKAEVPRLRSGAKLTPTKSSSSLSSSLPEVDQTKKIVQVCKCCFTQCSQLFADQIQLKRHLEQVHKMVAPEPSAAAAEATALAHRKVENWVIDYMKSGKSIHLQLKQAIINLKTYFEKEHPLWTNRKMTQEISKAINLGSEATVRRIFREYIKHGEFKPEMNGKKGRPGRIYHCTDEDREVIAKCIDKLKNENRLNGALDVFKEINANSGEFSVSFMGCCLQTFYHIFEQSGFKITETMIMNKKPDDEVDKPVRVQGRMNQCEWPGCDKWIKGRKHYEEHMRTHTREKPYGCRQPGCQYRCSSYGNLWIHLRKKHKMNITKKLSVERHDNAI